MSKSLSLHFLEFVVARVAEAAQQIERSVNGHFAQLDEVFVRLQIDIQEFSGNFIGTLDHQS